MKRLFVDGHVLDRGFEGVGSFIAGLYGALARQRPDLRIYVGCTDAARTMRRFAGASNVEPVRYASGHRVARLAYAMDGALRRAQADWAHFQYFTPLVKRCRWIVTIHDVLFNDFPACFPRGYSALRNVLFPLSAHRADLLTTVSAYSAARIAHWYRVAPARIHVLPCGVAPLRDLAGPAESVPVAEVLAHPGGYLLCVSRFEPRKNQARLLEAFLRGRLWERGLLVAFVGARTLPSPAFDRLLAGMPAAARDCVRLLEGVSGDDLQRLCMHAHAFVYPSYAEGFGIPPLEAALAGVPALCANATAMADFRFLAPFFFDPADAADLLRVLERVLADPAQARADARIAQAAVRVSYTWDVAAQRLARLIDAHESGVRVDAVAPAAAHAGEGD